MLTAPVQAKQTEGFILELAVDFLDPLAPAFRTPYTVSRLVVLADRTTVPVITLLAARKFGVWDLNQFPYWIDGDYTNEVLSNVDLAERKRKKASRRTTWSLDEELRRGGPRSF